MSLGRARRRTLSLLAASILLTGLAAGPVATQETSEAPDSLSEIYGSWTLSCGPERSGCHVFQALLRAKDKARMVQVTMLAASEGDGLVLRALTPLGAKLASGAELIIDDDEPISVPFDSCWQRGCIAETPLTPKLEAALRDGLVLAVVVVSSDTDQTIRFELSLAGVKRALEQLRKK
jgi:invasion protein IalB